MSNLDSIRLADFVLDEPKKISQFVENQFPSIYRENGQELIQLVKDYYRFLESETDQSIYNIRRIYDYRNVDKTLDRMIMFFKNKFLNGLFFEEDPRFIIKHILDLYRRKGSKEGIELFFKLFFDVEVEVYYPSMDLFKPSQSRWKEGRYIQLNPVTNISPFNDSINKKIFGSLSNAEAFIDNVIFVNIRDSIVPVIFLNDIKGQFQEFDEVFSTEPFVLYGAVYGSLIQVNVEQTETGIFSSDNKVGDSVEILSSNEGIGAKGIVTQVSSELSGEIRFNIDDGGFAFTKTTQPGDPDHNPFSSSEILISEQSLFLNNQNLDFAIEERIKQVNSSNTEVIGIVIGQNSDSIGIVLDETAPNANTENFFFEDGFDIETIDRAQNITRELLFTTVPNKTASFEIGALTNKQTLNIVIDIIEDFVNVPLDSMNYNDIATIPFSGANTVNLDTPLNEAFAPQEFTIGTIDGLKNINPGENYINDAFVFIKESLFSRFNLRKQVFSLALTTVNLFRGDIVTQEREILDFEGNLQTVTIKGEVMSVVGNVVSVKQLTFDSFIANKIEIINSIPTVVSVPIFKAGISTPIFLSAVSRDSSSRPAGFNANIRAEASFSVGKIQLVDVSSSGFGYIKNETVSLLNTDKLDRLQLRLQNALSALETAANTEIEDIQSEIKDVELLLESVNNNDDGFGTAVVKNQGKSLGKWISFESHINQEKVLQDSFFYQDYSYEISSSVSDSIFEDVYKDIVHPAGLKFFTKFSKTDVINSPSTISDSIFLDFGDAVDITGTVETANNGFNYIVEEE